MQSKANYRVFADTPSVSPGRVVIDWRDWRAHRGRRGVRIRYRPRPYALISRRGRRTHVRWFTCVNNTGRARPIDKNCDKLRTRGRPTRVTKTVERFAPRKPCSACHRPALTATDGRLDATRHACRAQVSRPVRSRRSFDTTTAAGPGGNVALMLGLHDHVSSGAVMYAGNCLRNIDTFSRRFIVFVFPSC